MERKIYEEDDDVPIKKRCYNEEGFEERESREELEGVFSEVHKMQKRFLHAQMIAYKQRCADIEKERDDLLREMVAVEETFSRIIKRYGADELRNLSKKCAPLNFLLHEPPPGKPTSGGLQDEDGTFVLQEQLKIRGMLQDRIDELRTKVEKYKSMIQGIPAKSFIRSSDLRGKSSSGGEVFNVIIEEIAEENKLFRELKEELQKSEAKVIELNAKLIGIPEGLTSSEIDGIRVEKEELKKLLARLEEDNRKMVEKCLKYRTEYETEREKRQKTEEEYDRIVENLRGKDSSAFQAAEKMKEKDQEIARLNGELTEMCEIMSVCEAKNRTATEAYFKENFDACACACSGRIKELEDNENDRIEEIEYLIRKYAEVKRERMKLFEEVKRLEESFKEERGRKQTPSHLGSADTLTHKAEMRKLLSEIEGLRKSYLERKSAAAYHKRRVINMEAELNCLRSIKNGLEEKNRQLIHKLKEAKMEITHLAVETKRLSQNSISFFGAALPLNGKGGEELKLLLEKGKLYNKLVRCPVCKEADRDSVIQKCMHVFCKECIDERIATRRRNCPSCNVPFSPLDIKQLYFS